MMFLDLVGWILCQVGKSVDCGGPRQTKAKRKKLFFLLRVLLLPLLCNWVFALFTVPQSRCVFAPQWKSA
jgi:hypothetical protein